METPAICDFNATPENSDSMTFMKGHCSKNVNKKSTHFQPKTGLIIDLIITINNNLFQQTHSLETGISEFDYLIPQL